MWGPTPVIVQRMPISRSYHTDHNRTWTAPITKVNAILFQRSTSQWRHSNRHTAVQDSQGTTYSPPITSFSKNQLLRIITIARLYQYASVVQLGPKNPRSNRSGSRVAQLSTKISIFSREKVVVWSSRVEAMHPPSLPRSQTTTKCCSRSNSRSLW